MIPIWAQATPTTIDFVSRWLSGDGGLLGISLMLNVVLLYMLRYLFTKYDKSIAERTEMSEKYAKDTKTVFDQVLENSVETTRAITEVSTIVKSIAEGRKHA